MRAGDLEELDGKRQATGCFYDVRLDMWIKSQVQGGWASLRMLVFLECLYVCRNFPFARWRPKIGACGVETRIGSDTLPTWIAPDTRRASFGCKIKDGGVSWALVINAFLNDGSSCRPLLGAFPSQIGIYIRTQ